MKENKTFHNILFEIADFVINELKFICIHPNNNNYAIYISSSSQNPIRVYKDNNNKKYTINNYKEVYDNRIKALEQHKKTLLKKLKYVEEDIIDTRQT